jgi:hypothetical protein
MKDLQLTNNGDLYINPETGDIEITNSPEQAIKIRLLWFLREWRLGDAFGIPYWEEILVKNPNRLRLLQLFRAAILSVEEVQTVDELDYNITSDRLLTIRYRATVDGSILKGVVSAHG